MSLDINQIYLGDARELLRQIEPNSIALNGNNIRGGKYNTQTRVHLVGGVVESASTDAGLYLYDRRIWVKDPAWENSKWHTLSYRAVDEFEYIYFFWKPGAPVVDRNKLTSEEWGIWGSRAVWNIQSVRTNDDHEAKFPVELPRRIVKLVKSMCLYSIANIPACSSSSSLVRVAK